MQPRNLIGLKWMEGIEDKTSRWSDAFETDKGAHRSTLDSEF